MTTYTRKPDGTVRQPNGHLLHPTRYIVKRLSGPQAGTMATFSTAEAASTEAFYLSDVENVCPAVYPPIYKDAQP